MNKKITFVNTFIALFIFSFFSYAEEPNNEDPNNICVVGKILPQVKQNELARAMLDSKEKLPCLKNANLR